MSTTKIHTIEPTLCTLELYVELCKRFQSKPVLPSTSIEEVMYNAGQQSVLQYIGTLVQQRTVSGDQLLTIKPASFIKKITRRIIG